MISQLKVLIADRSFTTSAGEITLKPFKFMQFALVLALIEQYLKVFSQYNSASQIVQELLGKSEDKYTILEDIVKLLGLVSNKETSFFEGLQYDEVISLLTEIIEMNIDFFSRIGQTLNPPRQETESSKIGESKLAD